MTDESDIAYVDSMKFSGTLEENLKTRFGIEDTEPGLENAEFEIEDIGPGLENAEFEKLEILLFFIVGRR